MIIKGSGVSEHGSLLAPEIRNGLVLYINSNLQTYGKSQDSGKTSTRTRCEH